MLKKWREVKRKKKKNKCTKRSIDGLKVQIKKKREEMDKRGGCTDMKFCKLSCVQLSHFKPVLRSEFISDKSHQVSNASFCPSWQ